MAQLTEQQKEAIRKEAGDRAVEQEQNDLDGVIIMKPFRAFVIKALLHNVEYTSKKGKDKGQLVQKTMLNLPRLIGLINKVDPNGVKFVHGGWGSNKTLELEIYDPSYERFQD